ncbi:hypothetical protein GCK32_000854 [Trichostrongylus colubriformis]|uniref:Molybdopterin synthase catalytic subunit n=1 Tax=Trichostrongylus colubriformis TaxID=6319 RepID=A0AAN8F157_TRICO
MSHTDEPDAANVIARALADIAIIGSQQHREQCLKISGSKSMADFAARMEESLNRFLHHGIIKAKRSRCTEDDWSSCRSPQARKIAVCTEERRNTAHVFESQLTAGDFSSAEEDAPVKIPCANDGQLVVGVDVTGCDFQDELFDTPPSSTVMDGSDFSPEPDSLPSTVDPITDSCSTFMSSDFCDDEFSEEERQMPPLLRRFSNSLNVRGLASEHGASSVQPSSAINTLSNHTFVYSSSFLSNAWFSKNQDFGSLRTKILKVMLPINDASPATNGFSFLKTAQKKGRVLAIAGCTNSGKTTIANTLKEKFIEQGATVHVIHQDEFFYPEEKVEKVQRKKGNKPSFYYNYDCVSAYDHGELANNIKAASLTYDYTVVEGNMLTECIDILKLCDRVMFFTLDLETCRRRRSKRSYDPPDMPGYFDEVVWPAYQQHLQRAQIFARENGRISFFDVTTNSDRPDVEFMNSLIRSLCNDFVRICYGPLEVEETMRLLASPSCAASSVFVETTPDSFGGSRIMRVDYDCHDEMAHKELRKLCRQIRDKYPSLERIVIFHRIGVVSEGEISVIVATSSPNQKDALNATEMGVSGLKSVTSIWKKEGCEDGDSSWKGNSVTRHENGDEGTTEDNGFVQLSRSQQNGSAELA